jgi:hypothetical protein
LFASWYAVIWSSTDRVPPADLGALVEELEGPRVAHVDVDGTLTLRPHPLDPNGFQPVTHSILPMSQPKKFPPGMRLKSERAYFADAYSSVVRGDYVGAVQRFADMADHYEVDGIALPYFAYAAAKTGDRLKIETVVDNAARSSNDFDDRLASAACEWLYRDTHDARFRTMLVEWLKSHEVIQPTQGWAYAMHYTYERDTTERVHALAMARYLDPSSERLRTATKADVEKAKAWFSKNNPFARNSAATESKRAL